MEGGVYQAYVILSDAVNSAVLGETALTTLTVVKP
jgi:hypothetical protein